MSNSGLLRKSVGPAVLIAALFFVPLAASTAGAQAARDPSVVEIDRDAIDLTADLLPDPTRPSGDTALTFNNTARPPSVVVCQAFSKNGESLGKARVRVPGNGLKYLRASDIVPGRVFVGSVKCKTQGHIAATAIFLGPGLTALPVRHGRHDGAARIRFPLVVAY